MPGDCREVGAHELSTPATAASTNQPVPLGFSAHIPELDGLRGVAILLVILCRYVGGPNHAPLGFWPNPFLMGFIVGWSGVDLFFVLSGFLIGGILLDARSAPNYFRAFYMRRVFRILPIYFLWTLLFGASVIAVLLFFPDRLGVTPGDLLRIPIQLLFLQNIYIGMPHFMWFVITWSLAVEEQFYLLAPPLIRFLTLRRLAAALAAAVVLAPVLRFLLFRYWAPGTYLCVFLMPCRADSLSCGMLLAVGWRDARFREYIRGHAALLQRVLLVLFLGVGGMLWWLVHPTNAVTVTIGLTWLASVMRLQFLGWLGGISYCVYVLHDAFNFFAHGILLHAEPQLYSLSQLGVTALALLATLGVASLSWRFLERPLIRRSHGYSYGEERRRIPAAGLRSRRMRKPGLDFSAHIPASHIFRSASAGNQYRHAPLPCTPYFDSTLWLWSPVNLGGGLKIYLVTRGGTSS